MSEDQARVDLREAAVHGLRWSAITRPLVEVVLFGSMIVLARLISPAEFGRFAVALIVGELAINIPNEGIGSALVQRKDVTREHLETGFALTLIVGVVLAVLTLAAATLLIEPVFGAQTAKLVRLLVPAFMIAALPTVPSAVLRRRLAFGTLSKVEIASTIGRALGCVGFALAGLEAEALIFGGLLSAVIVAVLLCTAAPPPRPRIHLARVREILDYGLPASLASISWVGFRNCDYAIIGARLGPQQAGYYFRAYSLAVEYQKKIGAVMGTLAFPLLARTNGIEDVIRVRTRMVELMTAIIFPLLVGLTILAPSIIPWVFGPVWSPAIVPTQILALGGAVTIVTESVGPALMAEGRARSLLGFGWAHFLAYAGGVLFATRYGLTGVAIAAAVVHTAFLFLAYVLMLRGTDESLFRRLWRDAGPATVSCLSFAAVAVPTSMALTAAGAPAAVLLVAVAATGGPAYLITLRVLFPEVWRTAFAMLRRVVPGARIPRLGRPAAANAAS